MQNSLQPHRKDHENLNCSITMSWTRFTNLPLASGLPLLQLLSIMKSQCLLFCSLYANNSKWSLQLCRIQSQDVSGQNYFWQLQQLQGSSLSGLQNLTCLQTVCTAPRFILLRWKQSGWSLCNTFQLKKGKTLKTLQKYKEWELLPAGSQWK